VVVLVCARLFGLQRCCVCEEFGVEGYKQFGIQLRMRVKVGLRVSMILICSTNLEGIVVPGDTGPRLDDVLASLEYILALHDKLECGFCMLLPGQGANNSRVTKDVSQGKMGHKMVIHEAEIFPNVVAPATARHDGESLHSDLGAHVLPNRINTMIKMGG